MSNPDMAEDFSWTTVERVNKYVTAIAVGEDVLPYVVHCTPQVGPRPAAAQPGTPYRLGGGGRGPTWRVSPTWGPLQVGLRPAAAQPGNHPTSDGNPAVFHRE